MSTRVRVCTTINASVAATWAAVERIETHVEWMADALSISFTSDQRRGVGTEFECVTGVGRAHLTDTMSITEWRPLESMGVDHRGVVTGSGRFTLEAEGADRTLFCWEEQLVLPWWLGAGIGGRMAQPVLSRVWSGNLRRLKRMVEAPAGSPTG